MSSNLFDLNQLNPEFKKIVDKFTTKPILKFKNFCLFLVGVLTHLALAYANYMKIYTNEVANIIYALFLLQSFIIVCLIIAFISLCYALANYSKEFFAKLDFKANSLLISFINYTARICQLTYIASLILTNHSFIFVSLILYVSILWIINLLTKQMLTSAANDLTQRDIDEICEMKEKSILA
jgi:hypothetical protein